MQYEGITARASTGADTYTELVQSSPAHLQEFLDAAPGYDWEDVVTGSGFVLAIYHEG